MKKKTLLLLLALFLLIRESQIFSKDLKQNAPMFYGIHHLKFPVGDLQRSLIFYQTVLNANRLSKLDHANPDGTVYAYILQIPNLGSITLELRHDVEQAKKQCGFDPVTFKVHSKNDLIKWKDWLDTNKVANSGVLTGDYGWLLIFNDPDGRRLRFYTTETHKLLKNSEYGDSPWLQPTCMPNK